MRIGNMNAPFAAVIWLAVLSAWPLLAPALEFNFSSLTGFTAAAEAALDRAAAKWTSRIDDPITVNIQTDFLELASPNIIGTAGSVTLVSSPSFSNNVIAQLKADAAAETDDAIVASLPTIGGLNGLEVALPADFSFVGHLAGTKANFKALALPGFDFDHSDFGGPIDAVINFNTEFNFDFDNGDGVTALHMDFETVAAHELGHALGFISAVDEIDRLMDESKTGTIAPTLPDLFRFGPGDNPSNAAEFAAATRNLIPGAPTFFDDTAAEYLFSTGVSQGDGRQASHWKDGQSIGILDPTLAFGQIFEVSEADFRILDVIGYDINAIPLPPGLILFGSAVLALAYRSRRPPLQ